MLKGFCEMTFDSRRDFDTGTGALPVGANLGAVLGAVRRFRREEDGSLIIFGLFAFVMMLLLAGVSLDLMRFEERRTVLQNTIDRAALAAADLDQTLDPKAVVKDYFTKAGLTPPADDAITVTQGSLGEYRKVEVNVAEDMPTWFMALVGVKTLSAPAASVAEESIGQIEISLVLDISGSMNSFNRLVNLKPAAKNFIDQMFDSTEAGKLSISIIPYSSQSAMTPELAGYFNMTNEHTDSNCIEFDDADFDATALEPASTPGARTYQRNGHFDPYYLASPPRLTHCLTDPRQAILPFSGDRNQLKTYIDNLWANGNTSIDIGTKWGAALLDPSLQPVVDGLIASGGVPAVFSERPYAYSDPDALKILILMTDGQNTTEYRLRNNTTSNPYYDEGQSLLVRNPWYRTNGSSSDDWSRYQYSLWDASKNKYYIFATGQWRSEAWGDKSGDAGWTGAPSSIPMTWQDVWHDMSIYWFADELIYRAYGSSSLRNQWRPASVSNPKVDSYITWAVKDNRTRQICAALRNNGVRIYTIAFEAPLRGQSLLAECQNAGYYAVEGLDINEAFSGIANSINKLRLTQ